ncbi:hypothetical protein JB92DRAFT_2838388 [Gautieria morchelliformis]|nr:hypothetical protein JB92DRAFT_2838388 [Gautieria morchelliformis]
MIAAIFNLAEIGRTRVDRRIEVPIPCLPSEWKQCHNYGVPLVYVYSAELERTRISTLRSSKEHTSKKSIGYIKNTFLVIGTCQEDERELIATLAQNSIGVITSGVISCNAPTSFLDGPQLESILGITNNLTNFEGNSGQRNWIVVKHSVATMEVNTWVMAILIACGDGRACCAHSRGLAWPEASAWVGKTRLDRRRPRLRCALLGGGGQDGEVPGEGWVAEEVRKIGVGSAYSALIIYVSPDERVSIQNLPARLASSLPIAATAPAVPTRPHAPGPRRPTLLVRIAPRAWWSTSPRSFSTSPAPFLDIAPCPWWSTSPRAPFQARLALLVHVAPRC